jgi:aspartate aminotransferase-like enzyme
VPERVRQAIARPVVSHRGAEFRAVLGRAEELIRPVLGTANPVMFLASSGTGMMEASLVNVLGACERVLIVVHGQFGERFVSIAKAMGAQVDTVDVEWGLTPDPEEIERRVAAADYRAVVVVHNESSTGVVADLAGIGAVLRPRPTLLVVDSVSGLGGMPMRQDEWGVDVVVSASQKALMCPPGVGLVSMSPKAWEVVRRDDRMARYYWDFRKAKEAEAKQETPFTTPVALMAGMREALEMIHEEGLGHVLERHRRLATALRAGCEALGLSSFARGCRLSNTVVALTVPEPWNGKDIVRLMYERHGTVIAGSRNKLSGRVIRIGSMGCVDAGDILTDLTHLEASLRELSFEVTPGAGVAVAAAMLH